MLKILKRRQGKTDANLGVAETVGSSELFTGRFQQTVDASTPEKIDAIASAERSASRSPKQRNTRKSSAVRTERWSARMDPEAIAVLELVAEKSGGKGAADGVHALVSTTMENGQFSKTAVAERVAQRAAKKRGK